MNGKKKTDQPKAKQIMLETMLVLLQERDFDKITITDICRSADLSRSTFYRYFTDKHDLMIQCFENSFLQAGDFFVQGAFKDYFSKLLTILYTSQLPFKRMLDHSGNEELQWLIHQRPQKYFIRYYRDLLVQDTASKIPEMVAVSICSSIIILINWWISRDFPIPIETIVSYIEQLIGAPSLFTI